MLASSISAFQFAPSDGSISDFSGFGNKQIFVQNEGFRNLEEGERVEFTVESSPKGPQAVNAVKL